MKENFGEKKGVQEKGRQSPWRKLMEKERREVLRLYDELIEIYGEKEDNIEDLNEKIVELEDKLERARKDERKKDIQEKITQYKQRREKEEARLEELEMFEAEKIIHPAEEITKEVVRNIRREMSDKEAIKKLREAAAYYENIYRKTGSIEAIKDIIKAKEELIKLYEIVHLTEKGI